MSVPSIDSIHSIVVRCPNWIGDAVMATPIFEDIKRIFPNAYVVALASKPISELLQGNPLIDEFITFSRGTTIKRPKSKKMIQELKKRRFDLGILLTRSFSSAWVFWRGNVKWRLGIKDSFRSILLNIRINPPDRNQHDVLSYRSLLHPFKVLDNDPKLCLVVSEEEIRATKERFGLDNKQCIVINPGAAYGSAKCWPKEYFRQLIINLSNPRRTIIFVGDKNSEALVDEIMQGIPGHIINCAGKTSLRDLLALIAMSSCVVSNDSGPMHIAAAFGKPLVAIFGSTNPLRTRPWGGGKVLKKDIPCSPCYLRTCPRDFTCMRSITVEEVTAATEEALATYENIVSSARSCEQHSLIKMFEQGKVSYQLLEELQSIDWDTLKEERALIHHKTSSEKLSLQPIDVSLKAAPDHPVSFLEGKNVGCLVMAGGQATRLETTLPKGLIPVSPYEKKPTLQIIAEKIKAYQESYGTKVFLGIMTSDFSHQKIVDFFQKNNLFGLKNQNLFFFRQKSLPLLDMNGELILVDGKLFLGPDGNGTIFHAFVESGICETWEREEIDYVSVINGDNPLLDPFHPCVMEPLTKGVDLSIAAVKRASKDESVGLFVKEGEKIRVVEYSEIDPALSTATDSSGSLLFQWANISYLACTLEACKKASFHSLPLHVAKKGKNGLIFWKAEYFIFDHLPLMQSCTVTPIDRRFFSPLKTFTGEYSPEGVSLALKKQDEERFSKLFPQSPPPEGQDLPQSSYYPKRH